MNAQKFTQKSLEAMEAAQSLAASRQNMSMDQEHLLLALTKQEAGLIPQLIKKMGLDETRFQTAVENLADSLPGVSGPGREAGKIYIRRPGQDPGRGREDSGPHAG